MEDQLNAFYKFTQGTLKGIDPKSTAIIVVDMQKYQVLKDYAPYKSMNKVSPGILDYFAQEVEQRVIPNLRKLIGFCHEVGITVIYTKFSSFLPDGSDLPRNVKKLNETSKELLGEVAFPYIKDPGSYIVEDIKPLASDLVIQKNTSGTFISTRLDSFLKDMKVETVLVTGVVTNFCVHSTAREASDYGFQVIIVEDCCAAWSPEIHEATLKSFGLLYGYILTYEKLMKKISRTIKKAKREIAMH